jgi:pimeloyl-ACP methyl ester carboxylesterase
MKSGQTLQAQGLHRIRCAPSRGPHDTARDMIAPATLPSGLPNGGAPAVGSARVRFGHIGERPHSKHLVIRTSDGVSLAVRDTGPRTAEHTVVFLHGLCLNQTSWERQITYLLGRYGESVRIISYDHRGHGRSAGAPVNTYRIDQLADDLAQVLTALDVAGPLTLVGHSMGGMTALAYLGRPVAQRPVEPHGLILVATAAGKLAARGLARLLATPAPAALIGLIQHTPEHALHALVGPARAILSRWRGPRRSATLAATVVAAVATTPAATAVGFLPGLRAYNEYATLATIHARTIVISGGADPLIPPSHAVELSDGIGGADHVHVPYAGHMLPQEAPHVINDAICQTIAQHQRDRLLSAAPLGVEATADSRALPAKKPDNCSQHSLNDQAGVRLVAGSVTNHVKRRFSHEGHEGSRIPAAAISLAASAKADVNTDIVNQLRGTSATRRATTTCCSEQS